MLFFRDALGAQERGSNSTKRPVYQLIRLDGYEGWERCTGYEYDEKRFLIFEEETGRRANPEEVRDWIVIKHCYGTSKEHGIRRRFSYILKPNSELFNLQSLCLAGTYV